MTNTEVRNALIKWGTSVHYQMLASYITDRHWDGPNPPTANECSTVRKHLGNLVKQGVVRRVRPGVYSAFGKERD